MKDNYSRVSCRVYVHAGCIASLPYTTTQSTLKFYTNLKDIVQFVMYFRFHQSSWLLYATVVPDPYIARPITDSKVLIVSPSYILYYAYISHAFPPLTMPSLMCMCLYSAAWDSVPCIMCMVWVYEIICLKFYMPLIYTAAFMRVWS